MKKIYFLFLLSALFGYHSNAQNSRSLIAHYNFKNGKVNNILDPYERVAISGNLQTTEGVFGDALQFDGSKTRILFPGRINEYLRGRHDFSIGFWFRSGDLQQLRSLMSKREFCDGQRMFDVRVSDQLLVEIYQDAGSGNGNVSAPITDREWHHYTFIREGSISQLFVDGVLADQNRVPRPVSISDYGDFAINDSPCIGQGGTGYLMGGLDELMIFAEALTTVQVEQLYNDMIKKTGRKSSQKAERPNGNIPSQLQNLFGNYKNIGNIKVELTLAPKTFSLRIFNPIAYEDFELLTFIGSYKIEAGQLILEGEKVLLFKDASSKREDENISYGGQPIIGELYDEVVIDLFAFDTRLKLKK